MKNNFNIYVLTIIKIIKFFKFSYLCFSLYIFEGFKTMYITIF